MDLTTYVGIIIRRWWLIGVCAVLVAVNVYAYGSSRPARYQARAMLIAGLGAGANGAIPTADEGRLSASSYARLATTPQVLAQAGASAGIVASTRELQNRVRASVSPDSSLIIISATAASAGESQRLTQAVAETVVRTASKIRQDDLARINSAIAVAFRAIADAPASSPNLAGLEARYAALVRQATQVALPPTAQGITVVAPAVARSCTPPSIGCAGGANAPPAGATKTAPKPLRTTLLAFAAALIVNSQLAVLLELLADRFARSDAQERVSVLTGLPVLGALPARGQTTDAFQDLCTTVMFTRVAAPVRSIAVVSAERGDGRSFVAAGLAEAVSELGSFVVLVDVDLHHPSIHERYVVRRVPGVSDVVGSSMSVTTAHGATPPNLASHLVDAPGHPRLAVLPAGSGSRDPGRWLASRFEKEVLTPLAINAVVIVDTPPIDTHEDALSVAAQCNAAVLVVNVRSSRTRAVRRAVDRLRLVGVTPLGVVVTEVPGRRRLSPPPAVGATTAPAGPDLPTPVGSPAVSRGPVGTVR